MERSARLAGVLAVVMGGLAAGLAAAAQPERGRARERGDAPPPLRGPAVRDEQPPGRGEGMTGAAEGERPGERIPPRVFMAAVRALEGEEADDGVRLTREQREKVRELNEEFQRERREYMQRHAEELRELRALAGEGQRRRPSDRGGERPDPEMGDRERGPGERGGDRGGAAAEGRRAALERLRDIERSGPQPEGLYKRVWAELRAEQREAVERELERYREERAREREEAYVRRRAPGAGRPEGAPGEMGSPARSGPRERERGGAGAAERRERLLRIFEGLSPEEQEAVLERLEQRLRERGPAGRPPRRGGDRPPPPMDDVEVPREPGMAPD